MSNTVTGLKGQQLAVAEALLEHGYLDNHYALNVLNIKNVYEVVSRLRNKGWNIDTNEDQPNRLYTLRRDIKQDVRLITTGLNQSLQQEDFKAALAAAVSIQKRLQPFVDNIIN